MCVCECVNDLILNYCYLLKLTMMTYETLNRHRFEAYHKFYLLFVYANGPPHMSILFCCCGLLSNKIIINLLEN